jgi:uncharacterized membrane protein YcaP (DUF421 family)
MEQTFLSIVVRVSVMYLVALAILRLSGKQTIGELSTMDFVVTTILGDAFDTVIFGEAPILQGVVYFVTIASAHFVVRFLASRSLVIHRLTASPPTTMIQDGMIVRDGLRAERVRVETVFEELRLKGEDRLEEVKEARLEENGQLSLLRKSPHKPVQKQDRKLLSELK